MVHVLQVLCRGMWICALKKLYISFSDENEDEVEEETNERLENRRAKAAKVAKVEINFPVNNV